VVKKNQQKIKHKYTSRYVYTVGFLNFILGILMLFLFVLLMLVHGVNFTTVSCHSDSMYPQLYCGCVVATKYIKYSSEIRPSDIVIYRSLEDGRYYNVLHRVMAIDTKRNHVLMKGDNNDGYDGWINMNRMTMKVIWQSCVFGNEKNK